MQFISKHSQVSPYKLAYLDLHCLGRLTSEISVPLYEMGLVTIKPVFLVSGQVMALISYHSYYCTLPDKHCLSHGMCLYQVMITLHFLNDVANDAELTQKFIIMSYFSMRGTFF